MHQYVIGVGSNIEPQKNIPLSRQLLEKIGSLKKSSRFIRTSPIGYTRQADFINGAWLFETKLDERELTIELKKIEKKLGRVRTENRNAARTIDLDIVVHNLSIIDQDYYTREFLRNSVDELIEGSLTNSYGS